MRKKPSFTHGRANLRGDVSEKRFSTHVGEGNVADIAQERLSDETGCTDTWHCHVGSVTGHCYRVQSQGTVTGHPSQGIDTGYCHESLPRLNVTAEYKQRHPG